MSSLVRVAPPMRTSRSHGQQRKRGDERGDESITAPETIFQSPRIRHIEVERSSGLVSCCVRRDGKGVRHVSGSGWRRLSAIKESGSAECVAPESLVKNVPLMETEASRQGQTVPHCRWRCHQEQRCKDCDGVLRDW